MSKLYFSLYYIGSSAVSKSCTTLPQPTLGIYVKLRDSVVLICRAPEGHDGVLFKLYRHTEEVFVFFLYNVLGYRTSGASGFIFSVLVFLKLRWTLGSSRAVLRRFSSLSP